jgi:hypothetical protein
MTKTKTYRTTREIVIPAGTEVGPAPHRTQYGTPHGSIILGFSKDTIGDLRFDIEDALSTSLIEEVS